VFRENALERQPRRLVVEPVAGAAPAGRRPRQIAHSCRDDADEHDRRSAQRARNTQTFRKGANDATLYAVASIDARRRTAIADFVARLRGALERCSPRAISTRFVTAA